MTKRGLLPGVAHNPDPTYTQAAANIRREEKRNEQVAAFRIFRAVRDFLTAMGYRLGSEFIIQNEAGHRFRFNQKGGEKEK